MKEITMDDRKDFKTTLHILYATRVINVEGTLRVFSTSESRLAALVKTLEDAHYRVTEGETEP